MTSVRHTIELRSGEKAYTVVFVRDTDGARGRNAAGRESLAILAGSGTFVQSLR